MYRCDTYTFLFLLILYWVNQCRQNGFSVICLLCELPFCTLLVVFVFRERSLSRVGALKTNSSIAKSLCFVNIYCTVNESVRLFTLCEYGGHAPDAARYYDIRGILSDPCLFL